MVEAIVHQWIYVIIPINRGSTSYSFPVFCAFCKGCRKYFTEELAVDPQGAALISEGNLPRVGCEPIDD